LDLEAVFNPVLTGTDNEAKRFTFNDPEFIRKEVIVEGEKT